MFTYRIISYLLMQSKRYIFICDFTENQGSKRYFSCSLTPRNQPLLICLTNGKKKKSKSTREKPISSSEEANAEQHEENQKSKKAEPRWTKTQSPSLDHFPYQVAFKASGDNESNPSSNINSAVGQSSGSCFFHKLLYNPIISHPRHVLTITGLTLTFFFDCHIIQN